MEENDPYIRWAMDCIEDFSAVEAAKQDDTTRKEPTALFFVIFGLVYEALSSASSDSSTASSQNTSLIALRTLKSIVQQEYSGKALLEPTIFDELLNLWYRMAMTEPPGVQIHLAETVAAFATSHAKQSMDLE